MSDVKEVARFPWATLYAKRTEAGGLAYFTDDIGGGQMIVDMTLADIDILRFIVEEHTRIDGIFDKLKR
jgi:hypothetical protein